MYEHNQLNNAIGKYIDTGVHEFQNGSNIVSSVGIKEINNMLREIGLPTIPESAKPKDISTTLLSAGVSPFSLGENMLAANNVSLTQKDKDGRQIGVRLGMIQRETSTPAEIVFFDITRKLDWAKGGHTFRTGGSCWWSQDNGRNVWRDSVALGTKFGNGFALRLFFESRNIPKRATQYMEPSNSDWYDGKYADRGRAWVVPVELGYIVFNWYDRIGEYRDEQYAQLLANLLQLETKQEWRTSKMYTKGANGMYLNSEYAALVYAASDESKLKIVNQIRLSEHIPVFGSPMSCIECGERYPKSGWTKDSLQNIGNAICHDCKINVDAGMVSPVFTGIVKNNTTANHIASMLGDFGGGKTGDCVVTRTRHYISSMIDVSGLPIVTDNDTNKVYPEGSMCFVGIFNYYFKFVDGNPVRRIEKAMPRKQLKHVVGDYVSELKEAYGKAVGRIQYGVTFEPEKMKKLNINQIQMQMARSNQLWLNLDWAE